MINSKRNRPRQLGLAAKLAGVQPKEASKPKRLGKRAAPRRLSLSARILAETEREDPTKRVNSYRRRKRWPGYKAFLAEQACIVTGKRPVQVAHCGDRGLSNKSDDRWCLPISQEFHARDGGPNSLHRLGKKFWPTHGLDRDELVNWFNQLYASIDGTFQPLIFDFPISPIAQR